jgi:hypothetical protein
VAKKSKAVPEVPPTTAELVEVGQIAAAGIALTTEQAATYLQLAAGTLAVWRVSGYGPKFVLVATRPRYLKTDLDAWMAGNKARRIASPNVGRPPKRKRGGR